MALDELFDKFKPQQMKSEIFEFLKIVEKQQPRKVLEIGTLWGGTMVLFMQVLPKDAQILSLDIAPQKLQSIQEYKQPEQTLDFIIADSHEQDTLRRVREHIGEVDFLFIDGDHMGVQQDFEMYSPLVKKGGFIGMHDIHDADPKYVGVVPEYWRSIKHKHNSFEIVHNHPLGCGIGVISC
jgi:predicted O-methyltransferase YrrM